MKDGTPDWALKFQYKVIQLEIIAGPNNWYKHPQPYLSVLKRTGRGNCVAWSKLVREIALKAGLIPVLIVIGGLIEDPDDSWHQFCVIIDNDNTIWYQNCRDLVKLRKIHFPMTNAKFMRVITEIANIVGKRTGYLKGTIVHEIIDHPFES